MLSRIALSLLPVFLALASGQSCDLFSLDECANPPNCPYEEVTKTDDPTTCSQFCNINPNCKSWAHLDREGVRVFLRIYENILILRCPQLCRLIQCPITEWSEYCTLIGGPVEPSMAECQILDEGCDAHRRSFCAPKDPVGILNNINTPEVCQVSAILSMTHSFDFHSVFPEILPDCQ